MVRLSTGGSQDHEPWGIVKVAAMPHSLPRQVGGQPFGGMHAMDAIADATGTIRAPGFRSGSAITAIIEDEHP